MEQVASFQEKCLRRRQLLVRNLRRVGPVSYRMSETPMAFIPRAARSSKPRRTGLTEIRGPYYSTYGPRHLADVLEVAGAYVDGVKWAGGAFAVMPKDVVAEMNRIVHEHDAYVSTGGWIEAVLRFGPEAVDCYLHEASALGFDVVELSQGFVTMSTESMLRLVERVRQAGLKPKPELGIQFGAGGSSSPGALAAEGMRPVEWLIAQARTLFEAGVDLIMIESEGLTENVEPWRTDVSAMLAAEFGLNRLMFEAADPKVFEWYVKSLGNDVNLFVDHSQIVQLEALRSGVWGSTGAWGRIVGLP